MLYFGLMAFGAHQMLYYPSKYPAGEWSLQQALGARDVSLQALDGTKLHAWWIQLPLNLPRPSMVATLHLHGNGGNITHRALSARNIVSAGSPVLLLDYRGYGKSEGKPYENGLYRDAQAGFDWIVAQGYLPQRIVIHGESLGTAIATHLATKRQ